MIVAYELLRYNFETKTAKFENISILDRALEIKNGINSTDVKGEILQNSDKKDTILNPTSANDTKNSLPNTPPPTYVDDPSFNSNSPNNRSFEKLDFRGDTKEYFRIWIVNIFLTIVTLGIYSAWAKVRTNRYFYANTFYKNHSFEYTANPLNILKGRVIVVSFYLIFFISSQVVLNPFITLFSLALFVLVLPWMINKAVKFRLKYTSYRGVHFAYNENAPKFYTFFLFHAVLNIVTFGFAYPYSLNEFKKLIISNASYGDAKFSYHATAGSMYKSYMSFTIKYILAFILAFAIFMSLGSLIWGVEVSQLSNPNQISVSGLHSILFTIASLLFYAFIFFGAKGIWDATIQNFTWNNTTLKDIEFKSTLKASRLVWIYMTNILAIVASLGLLTPWTKVRTVKYKCENFEIKSGDLSGFIQQKRENESALGEETDDFFDIDIGF
jgi:uncharacterized membrane protein YjgN (DUF898 family)